MLKNDASFRIVEEGAIIGEDTCIWNFTHIRASATIGDNCNIGNNVYIDSHVNIGNNVKIQNSVNVYHGVSIKDDVFVGPGVTFTNDLSPRAFIWGNDKITETIIEKGASIGANSTIKCGISLGEYCMIGAGSMITKSIPNYTVAVGNPGKIIGLIKKDGTIITDIRSHIISQKEDTISCDLEGSVINISKKLLLHQI